MNKSMTRDESKKFAIPVNNICFKDKLNDNKPSPGGYIINLADSTTHGTHWTALWLESPSHCAYFDSFGIAPPLAVEEFCRRYGCHKILMSQVQIQNINSEFCGEYATDFLAFMSRNKRLTLEKRYRIFLSHFHDGSKRAN